MGPDAPITFDHAGFAASFHATRDERGWSLAFLLFAPVWTLIVLLGVLSEAVWDMSSLCMVLTVPFIWVVSLVAGDVAVTRHTLRLTNGQLLLETRKVLRTRKRKLDPRGLTASIYERSSNKGGRIVGLNLELADGEELSLSASNWRTPDLERLRAMLNVLAREVDAETARVPPEALQKLRSGLNAS